MKAHDTPPEKLRPRSQKISRWQAKNLRSASKTDICFLVAVLLLAYATVWSGNMMALHLSPRGSMAASNLLDDLQVPRLLPNGPLMGEGGETAWLWDLLDRPRTVVSFYAPWCAPCQKELPELVELTKLKKNLLIIVSANEDPKLSRQQLDNLGLKDSKILRDITGKIMEQGKVKSLPTTFLVGRMGKVRERVVGYSSYRLHLLLENAGRDIE
jgi:thiol-disulfide isomerase/thioredoxin